MPRRSPRSHNLTRATDTKIAARITTLHIYKLQHGAKEIKDEEGRRGCPQSEHRQSDHNQHKLQIPPLRISWPNCLEHCDTRVLSLPHGCWSSIPLTAPKQKAKEKGGKTRGYGKNGPGAGSNPSGLPHPTTPVMEPGWSTAWNCLP